MDPAQLEADGWQPLQAGGFDGYVGPFWLRGEGENRTVGLIVEQRHANNHMGTIHGGVVMTFADIALGAALSSALGEGSRNCVTISLQTQFISTARIGEFIYCKPELIRAGKQMVFVRGLIKVGEKTLASVEGVWKVLSR